MGLPKLCVPLVLEEAERVPDGMGGFQIDWRPVARVWADMRSGAGRQQSVDVGAKNVVSWKITVRSARQGDPRRPKAEQRLRMASRLFLIEAVAEADPQGRWLTCFAREEN